MLFSIDSHLLSLFSFVIFHLYLCLYLILLYFLFIIFLYITHIFIPCSHYNSCNSTLIVVAVVTAVAEHILFHGQHDPVPIPHFINCGKTSLPNLPEYRIPSNYPFLRLNPIQRSPLKLNLRLDTFNY